MAESVALASEVRPARDMKRDFHSGRRSARPNRPNTANPTCADCRWKAGCQGILTENESVVKGRGAGQAQSDDQSRE
jgi:hypothetical protein